MDKSARGNYLWHSKIPEKFYRTYDPALVEARWQAMLAYQAKAEQIKKLKEEAYQDGFLRDIFVSCLGYALAPEPDSNLVRELKNEVGAKKADGAIVFGGEVRAVIELKDQKTRDLDEVEDQAFRYRRSHRGTRYVIISNFGELRFYIDDSVDFQRFDLFTLTREEFEFLHLCLCRESISSNLPLSVLDSAKLAEQNITAELYRKFAAFRAELFASARALNPAIAPARVLELVQKFLDRVIFVLFAEDKGLLPANTVLRINEQFETQTLTDFSLIQIWRKYFRAIDEGNAKLGIPLYNGGLFRYDPELDSDEFALPDDLLKDRIASLAAYDFVSDVGVNILGHIFEQSLSDLEELNAQIDGAPVAKNESKRKKDGVFYTPEFVTRFIVSHTLGELCAAQKSALNLDLAALTPPKNPRRLTKSEKETLCALKSYREYLLNLKILDPACGSGAFLIAALEWLIREHSSLDRARRAFEGEELGLYDVAPDILERNLYGVDINAGAVEVAKLSLWLRTARKGRALTSLSGKIKCGNSLIDDSNIDEKAFIWEKEFPEIMANGGFDIIIGNPPYFNIQTFGASSPKAQWIQSHYSEIWQDKSDILFYFIYKALKLSKNQVGFIVSNAFLFSDKAQKLRNFIVQDNRLNLIFNFEKFKVFEDASIASCILIFDKIAETKKAVVFKNEKYGADEIAHLMNNDELKFEIKLKPNEVFSLVNDKISNLNAKIDANHKMLQDLWLIGKGMETAANGVFLFDEYPQNFPPEFIKKHLSGESIKPYSIAQKCDYLLYFENVENFDDLPQSIRDYLLVNKEILENRATCKNEGKIWWRFSRPMHKEFYNLNKIWCSYRNAKNEFALDESGEYIGLTNTTVIFDTNSNLNLKYLLTILNSRLFYFRYSSLAKQTGSGVFEYFANGVGKFRVPEISPEAQKPLIDLADKMLALNAEVQSKSAKFLSRVRSNLNVAKITTALEKFDELDFAAFLKELAKQKIKLSLKDQDEWEEYFESYKSDISNLKSQIAATDREINTQVYALYGLSADEIALIENQI